MPALRSAWEKEPSPEKRLDLAMLLAAAMHDVEDGAGLKQVSDEILAKYPDSYVAMAFAGEADDLLKDWSGWNAILDTRLTKHPDDEHLLRMKTLAEEAQGNWVQARATGQILMDKGKAQASDYNGYAWTGLFDGKVNADVEKAAQQASTLSKNTNFAELHTLACIYAFEGKTSEARELLLQAMAASNISEPNSEVWFGFGSIYEKYGVNDAAIEAYRKVEKPVGPIGAADTYVLAEARLKALGAQ
jgi:tetratricopeptide (TPR) repeat protein